MKSTLFGILCFMAMNSFPAFAMNEPQTIDPVLDQEFLAKFPDLFQPGTTSPDIFNILIIGQDDSAGGRLRDKRRRLGSRSDIIMVLSLNRITKVHTILSVYRDQEPTQACLDGAGFSYAPDGKINGVYSLRGRKGFIPCIQAMIQDMIYNLPAEMQADVLDAQGEFKIHAFFEGTRSQTIKPMGQDITSVVYHNKAHMIGTFGVINTSLALATLGINDKVGNGVGYLLGDNPTDEDLKKMVVNPRYLTVELKERHIYPAGGYQRAFNFATVVSTILGWTAYGIEQNKAGELDFIGKYFGKVIDDNLSHSISYETLEKEVFMRDGDNILRSTCFKGGLSPVRIVQWGESPNRYAIYANGKLFQSSNNSMVNHLTYVNILPAPSECE